MPKYEIFRSSQVSTDCDQCRGRVDLLKAECARAAAGSCAIGICTAPGCGVCSRIWEREPSACSAVPVIPDVVVMPVVHVRDADSVLEAVRTVRPSGVDVCSGVRRGGRLDRALLTAFMAHVFATHG